MRNITAILLFCTVTLPAIARTADISGYVTGMYTSTSANKFTEKDAEYEIGFMYEFDLPFNATIKGLSTTTDTADYLFLEAPGKMQRGNYGVRIGRVARYSGFFSGNGVHVDKMNYLPQGTSPARMGNILFRIDGIQFFYERSFGTTGGFYADFTYGEPVFDEEFTGGILDPSTFTLSPIDFSNLSSQKPAFIITSRLRWQDWEVFLDVTRLYMTIETTPFPGVTFSNTTPTNVYKTGLAYNFESTEVLFTYYNANSDSGTTPDPSSLWAWDLMARTSVGPTTMVYYGYTRGQSDITHDLLLEFGIPSQDYIDYNRGLFAGVTHDFHRRFSVTAEVQRNTGGFILNSDLQEPKDIRKHWWVGSVTATYKF